MLPLTINIGGSKVVSWPYVGLTLQALENFGVPFSVERKEGGVWSAVDWHTLEQAEPGNVRFRMVPAMYRAGRYAVEGDWSGASYLLAAGAIGPRPVRIEGLRADSLQGDRVMLDILRDMGARIDIEPDAVTVHPSELRGVVADMSRCPDLVPTVAVVAAHASGPTRLWNAAHLRIKECDRIAVPAQELSKVGVRCDEHDDGLTIHGDPALASRLHSLDGIAFFGARRSPYRHEFGPAGAAGRTSDAGRSVLREQIVPEFLGMLGTGAGMSGNTAESGFTPRRLVIVGCRGRMGTLLSARWSAAGHTVAGLDLPLTDEVFAEALPGADAVFLCIPAGAMAEVLPHLVPHLDGRQILADITSVKMQPLGQMERAYAGPVVGTHPLFGP